MDIERVISKVWRVWEGLFVGLPAHDWIAGIAFVVTVLAIGQMAKFMFDGK